MNQRTISTPVSWAGIGLYGGGPCSVRLLPAAPDTGICFYPRPRLEPIPARLEYARVSDRTVVLSRGDLEVRGVEHLLAACYGLGVDQLQVEVSGGELPMGDGSAHWATELIRTAGIKELSRPRPKLRVRSPIIGFGSDRLLALLPAHKPGIFCYISFSGAFKARQFFCFRLSPDGFERKIAPARTFGAPSNPMIIDQLSFGVRWAGGWLLPAKPEGAKEFVRHKILDLLGDLALLGRLILGWVVAYRPGHAFNLQFLTGVERRCDGDR